jgi:hypothetical protein
MERYHKNSNFSSLSAAVVALTAMLTMHHTAQAETTQMINSTLANGESICGTTVQPTSWISFAGNAFSATTGLAVSVKWSIFAGASSNSNKHADFYENEGTTPDPNTLQVAVEDFVGTNMNPPQNPSGNPPVPPDIPPGFFAETCATNNSGGPATVGFEQLSM